MRIDGVALSWSLLVNVLLISAFLMVLTVKIRQYYEDKVIEISIDREENFESIKTKEIEIEKTKKTEQNQPERYVVMNKPLSHNNIINDMPEITDTKAQSSHHYSDNFEKIVDNTLNTEKSSLSGKSNSVTEDEKVTSGSNIDGGTIKTTSAGGPKEISSAGELREYQKVYEEKNWRVVRDLIEKNLSYPAQAVILGWEGKVVIRICIESSVLCGHEILKTSGYKILDEAVLKAVKRIDGKLPYSKYRVYLTLPIVFELRR